MISRNRELSLRESSETGNSKLQHTNRVHYIKLTRTISATLGQQMMTLNIYIMRMEGKIDTVMWGFLNSTVGTVQLGKVTVGFRKTR